MAGETDVHGDISVNLVISLGSQLKETPCRARTKDTKVRSGRIPLSGKSMRGLFSYPDIVVVCGEPEYPDASATFTIGSHLLNDAPYREYSPRKRKGRRQLPPAQWLLETDPLGYFFSSLGMTWVCCSRTHRHSSPFLL